MQLLERMGRFREAVQDYEKADALAGGRVAEIRRRLENVRARLGGDNDKEEKR